MAPPSEYAPLAYSENGGGAGRVFGRRTGISPQRYGIVQLLFTNGEIMATLENLQAKIAKLQAQAEALVAKESSDVIKKIRDLMERHGITTADIDAHIGGNKSLRKSRAKVAGKSAAKYRDPKTGATWTGHGRAPVWIANAKDRTRFLVDNRANQPTTSAKRSTKAGNYVRGPQPAKYCDPKSGATWSGRGPAPAWLASAKDRSKFLIDTVGAVAADAAVASKTKPVAKRAAAKKVGAETVKANKVPTAKKTAAKKAVPTASKKASGNNARMTEAALASPSATVESGAESTS